jgi:hypothetical protein
MFIQFSGKCGKKDEIMDKNFESTYEHLSDPEMFIQFSGKCGQKHEIMDKSFESTYEHS